MQDQEKLHQIMLEANLLRNLLVIPYNDLIIVLAYACKGIVV
jgi:hypothetical protein